MFDSLIAQLILLVGGVYFLVRNIKLLRDPAALRDYVQTSPSARLWLQKYGLSGAMKMARDMIPLGLIIAGGMIALGAWSLWRTYI